MGKILLLDCTLRDGGYVNNWEFGEKSIKGISKKIAQTGIEIFEIGFIKGNKLNLNKAVFPDIESISDFITPKDKKMMYVGMIDMSEPVPLENICPYDGTSVDGLRIIFKKDMISEAFGYCREIKNLGYKLFVQFVGTDNYSDKEFIETIEKFNVLDPYAVAIVDSFGLIKRKQFLRLVYLADNNLKKLIILGYHAHNNLQQAFGNAEALVEMNLMRDICIDACIFGMGRGAGNLNLELFSEYLNENHGSSYRIEPMLEIMDEYLMDIYKEKFWGYSLPLYLSATTGCHPNYAIYLAEKDTLTVKSFNEILKKIPANKKQVFSQTDVNEFYYQYMENYVDDKECLEILSQHFRNRKILVLAPGNSLNQYKHKIEKEIREENLLIITVNFISKDFESGYVFSSNMRRYKNIESRTDIIRIITSNIKETDEYNYKVNFASYSSSYPEIADNSGIMLLKLLLAMGIKEVYIAGMDGYLKLNIGNYINGFEFDFLSQTEIRNTLIYKEITSIKKKMKLIFLTPTLYDVDEKNYNNTLYTNNLIEKL